MKEIKNDDRSQTQYLRTHTHYSLFSLKHRAFSLAEMMVVMLILSLVLAASVPIMTRQHNTESTALAQLRTDLTTAINDLTTRLDALEGSSGEEEAECPDTMVKVVDLCVAKTDAGNYTWNNAKVACYNQGMRLPTIEELRILFDYRNTIGGFSSSAYYWSATENYDLSDGWGDCFAAIWQFTAGALPDDNGKAMSFRVRCVKNL